MAGGPSSVRWLLHKIQNQRPIKGYISPARAASAQRWQSAVAEDERRAPEADFLQAETPSSLTCRVPDAQAASLQRWQSAVAEEEERRAFADAAASETAWGNGRGLAVPGAPPRASSRCTPHNPCVQLVKGSSSVQGCGVLHAVM